MADRPGLDAVLFDAGGTLVRLDFEWLSVTLSELGAEVSAAELRAAELHGRRRYDASAGQARRPIAGEAHPPLGSAGSTHAYWSGMLEAADVRHPILEEAIERMHEKARAPSLLWGRPNEGAAAAIAGVRALGLRAACVSNSDGRAEHHLVVCGVRDGLEFVVDSQIEGVEKPDPRLFHVALDRLGVRAERALYVGDIRSVDERGARAAGMHFVLIDPSGGYAGPETPSIATIGDLPAYVQSTFAVLQSDVRPIR